MHPTTFPQPETMFLLLLISWLVMLALGSFLGGRGVATILKYHQSYKDAKTKEIIDNHSDECAKSKARDMKHIKDLAEKDEQIAEKVTMIKEAEQEIKLLWDGTNGTDGLHHLRQHLKNYQEGNAYQEYQYDLSFANRTNNQLMERITRLKSMLVYEKEKNDGLAHAQVEYRNDIKRYRYQITSLTSKIDEISITSGPASKVSLAQTVEDTLTLSPVVVVYRQTSIVPIFPPSQLVAAPIIQQFSPQLPPNYHYHLKRSQKLDEIQGILTKFMHAQGLLDRTKHRASPDDVRKAIKYDLPELMQKSHVQQSSLSSLQNLLDSLQLDTNTGYLALFPEEAAKTSGQVCPQSYLRAISHKVRILQVEIETLRHAPPVVTVQPPNISNEPHSAHVNPSIDVPTTLPKSKTTVGQEHVHSASGIVTSDRPRTQNKTGKP